MTLVADSFVEVLTVSDGCTVLLLFVNVSLINLLSC